MKALIQHHFPRFLAFLIGLTIATATSGLFRPLTPRRSPSLVLGQSESVRADRSREILSVLMPSGDWADDSKLRLFDHHEVVSVLKSAEIDAHGNRALGIAFLLAVLDEDYFRNRSKLLDALQECRGLSYPAESQCADFVSSYLMELARRGDVSLLRPLFDISDLADGAFSQSLGTFYADMLETEPKGFLLTLSSYSPRPQRDLCYSAAIEDGSGMDAERSVKVKAVLNSIARRRNDPLSNVAKNCLAGVNRGLRKT